MDAILPRTIALLLAISSSQVGATDLKNLIPGLYGGDGITLAPPSGPFPSHAAHFTIDATAAINQLNNNISAQIAVFPFPSISSGFAFEFNPDLGTFLKTPESLGPIFAERPRTVGAGKFTANLSYTFFEYNKFEGASLDDLEAVALHDANILPPPDVHTSFELDTLDLRINLGIKAKILALAATYGVTDRFDIGVLVPYVWVNMDVRSHAQLVVSPGNPFPTAHSFGSESPDDAAHGSASGLGDVLLQAKYHWLKTDTNNVAGAVLVKTETGDANNFLGTGDTTVRPYLIYARSFGAFTPHINLGYKFNLKTSDKNAIEYALGFDYGNERYTVAANVIGSRYTNGSAIGDNIINGALGVKWNPSFAKNLIVSANALFPLNQSGLRSNLITTVALEYGF